ncbi:hypothetical protein ACIBI4_19305 [Streptomyces sp. NPDC050418]|uniref:hypothetical protein n=1 Tax=Streptomyces sp. NPDC050418 TaxID=3365612 RepID=UPI003796AD94
MRATRRTAVRSAAVATAVIAGLSLQATHAFADSPATPDTGQEQVLPGNETKPGDEVKPGDETKPPTDETKPGDQDRQRTSEPQGRQLVKTVSLPDGWSAKVYKEAGKGYDADLLKNGNLQAKLSPGANNVMGWTFTLTTDGNVTAKNNEDGNKPKPEAKEKRVVTEQDKHLVDGYRYTLGKIVKGDKTLGWFAEITGPGMKNLPLEARGTNNASAKHNGYTFQLTSIGKLGYSKDSKPTPKPDERKHVHTYKNIGGSGFDAKVFKVKGGYDAEMWGKDPASGKYIKWDTLQQRGSKSVTGQHNGAYFVLNPDGTMKGWTEGKKDSGKKEQPKKNEQGKVVPKGGVKAGAENVTPGDDTALLAAGGGMAAAGAAGLGFALLRRRGDQQG